MHAASQVDSKVPKLSLVLTGLTFPLLPKSGCPEGQDEESCLLPFFLGNALELIRNSSIFRGWNGKLVKRMPFLLENDLIAVEYIMGWAGVS